MKAYEFLQRSCETMTERGSQNGYDSQEERSAAEIARLFNVKRGHSLTEADAWAFLVCLKEVRLKRQIANGSDITDTLIDLVSYQALLAECESEKLKTREED